MLTCNRLQTRQTQLHIPDVINPIQNTRHVTDYNPDNTVTKLGAGKPGIDPNRRSSPFVTTSRPALGPAEPPVRWVPRFFSRGGKTVGAWSWLLASIQRRGKECVTLYLHSPIRCLRKQCGQLYFYFIRTQLVFSLITLKREGKFSKWKLYILIRPLLNHAEFFPQWAVYEKFLTN
jgi:hypothetical protein